MSRFDLATCSPLVCRAPRSSGTPGLVAAVVLACCACEARSGSEATVVPEGLRVIALPGGNGVLEVSALTLRKGDIHTEVFAALRNTGEVPACHAAFAVELFDGSDQSLAAGIAGLLTQQFYRRTDGSKTVAACVAPGGRTMAAITDLPPEIELEDVSSIVYRCPYFALDVEAIAGLTVERVETVARSGGFAYVGTLVNTLDVSVDRPSVSVFPVSQQADRSASRSAQATSGSRRLASGNSRPARSTHVALTAQRFQRVRSATR